MTAAQLIEDYTRVHLAGGVFHFEVGIVSWRGHRPETDWKSFRRWKREPTPAQIQLARARALKERRFFRTCGQCAETSNIGHMHDDRICQSCAEKHGAMY